MRKRLSRPAKLATLLTVIFFLTPLVSSAFAVGFNTYDLDISPSNTVTFAMIVTALETPDFQAPFVASVANTLLSSVSSNFKLDTSAPAFIRAEQEKRDGDSVYSAYIYVYFRFLDAWDKPRSYAYVYFPGIDRFNTSMVLFDNDVYANAGTAKFLSVGNPYETPEQMTAYLDSQDYTYYTVPPEALAEAQAALEAN